MRTIHLCSGIGGGLLADLILGHIPVCAVEWDEYCCNRLRELRDDGWYPGLHVHQGDLRLFNSSQWKGRVDCLHAGFPCQPFSCAGAQRGEADERNLWPAVLDAIRIIRPQHVFLENVPGLLGFDYVRTIFGDLAALGYDGRWLVVGADATGAPHERDRWLCLCTDADREGQSQPAPAWEEVRGWPSDLPAEISDPARSGLQVAWDCEPVQRSPVRRDWWSAESNVVRMVHGVPHRVHRIKALGNAQIPLQIALAWRLLGGPVAI